MVGAIISSRYVKLDKENNIRPGERRSDFYCRILQDHDKALAEVEKAEIEAAKQGKNQIKLTDEQKEYLSSKYNPQDMSPDEYAMLLEDLQELGIMSAADNHILMYGAASRLNVTRVVSTQDSFNMSPHFECSNGNLLDWARFRASYRCYSKDGFSTYQDRTALLYEKLYNILTQI